MHGGAGRRIRPRRRRVPAQCDGLVADVVARFGRLDILVNNAGIVPAALDRRDDRGGVRPGRRGQPEVRLLPLAGRGPGHGRAQVGPDRQHGSTGARTGGLVNATVYSATKAGVISMTKSFARTYAKDNILVNAVAPGSVEHPDDGGHARQRPCGPCWTGCRSAGCPSRPRSRPSSRSWRPMRCSYMTGATVDVNGGAVMP